MIAGLYELHVLLLGRGISNQPERVMDRALSKNARDMGKGSYEGQYVDASPYDVQVCIHAQEPLGVPRATSSDLHMKSPCLKSFTIDLRM